MAIVTGNFGALLAPGFRKIWGDSFTAKPTQYTQIFNITSEGNRAYVEDHSITTLGLPVRKAEGAPVTYDTAYDGYTKRYTFVSYALGISITREMMEDDLYAKMKKMPSHLGSSNREFREIVGANILNRAFSASYLGGDGKALCANDHPTYGGGGTYSNIPSLSADLDITSYETALIDIRTNFIDDRGKKIQVLPKKLIITPSNWFMAEKILKSAQEPDTPNNAVNPARGTMPGGYIVLDYLTDLDAWFILTDSSDGLNWIDRRMPEFTQDNDFDSENAKFKTTMRFDAGWTNPRCIYGSAGA